MGVYQERVKFDSLSESTKVALLIKTMTMASNHLFRDPATNGFFNPIEDRFNEFHELFLDGLTEENYEDDVAIFYALIVDKFPYLVPEDVLKTNDHGWIPVMEPVLEKVRTHLGL